MDNATSNPLSPEQAKQRLRTVARDNSVAAWVRRRPYRALAAGFLAGLLFGGCPPTCEATARRLLRLLLESER